MPKVLKQFEFKASTVGHSQYDWDTLLNGQIYHLEQGEGKDFECKPDTMTMLIRKNARKKGVGVKVTKVENDGIVMQATGPKDYPPPRKRDQANVEEGDEGDEEVEEPAKPTPPAAPAKPAPKAGAATPPAGKAKPKAK